jgi:peptide/nickel transport system substrate-binding protein
LTHQAVSKPKPILLEEENQMNTRKHILAVFSILLIAAFVLSACQGATPTPEKVTVVETVIVAGTPVVQEKVITATPAPVTEAPTTEAFLPADGMVPCQPLPPAPEPSAALDQSVAAAPSALKNAAPIRYAPDAVAPLQTGKVYRVGVFEDVTTTNFWAANGPDNTVWNSYMLPERLALYVLSPKYFTFRPYAAAGDPGPLTQEGDKWVSEVKIRDDVKWSDGTPFTAKDFAFTANTVLKFGLISGNWASWYDANFLESVEAVDDTTAKVIYHTKPGLARHEYGVLQGPILQEAYWKPVADAAAAPIDALGAEPAAEALTAAQTEATTTLFSHVPDGEPTAGAFTLDKWEKGAFMSETAFADYLDKGLEVKQWANAAYEDSNGFKSGTPEGDPETTYTFGPTAGSLVYTIYGSQDAAILALKNGEVDFVLNSLGLQRGLAEQIKSDPNLTVIENSVNGFRYLSFNNRRRPMNDCAFRQAVAVLIDKEFVSNTILQGVAIPNYAYVPPGNAYWYNPDAPRLGEGMDREQRVKWAVAILEQAGYTWEGGTPPTWDAENRQVVKGGNMIMPDGTPVPPISLIAPSPGYDPLRSTFAVWIETWLNEMGIPVKADLAGFNVLVPIIFSEQNFDMYILGWSLSIFPSYLNDFFSEEQAALEGNNAGGYINPEFETLSKALLTCTTFEECKKIGDDLQMLLGTENPYVLLFDTGIIEAFRSAGVEYPFTDTLSGLQYVHQTGGPMQALVTVK